MQRLTYTGELWDGPALQPVLWELLLQKDLLLEFATGQPPYQVVLGAPHHAAAGVDQIAENWYQPKKGKTGRSADENTGLTALVVFSACRERDIPARLVVAAHPTDHDPNKTRHSPYWQSMLEGARPAPARSPYLLFELHGAGKRRAHDLELSAGRNAISQPLAFGAALAERLPVEWKLAVQSRPGTRQGRLFHPGPQPVRLDNPALETTILEDAGQLGIPALHLEMKAFLRQPDPAYPGSPRPNRAAWLLARALAEVIQSQAD